jgi:hypothetical protein
VLGARGEEERGGAVELQGEEDADGTREGEGGVWREGGSVGGGGVVVGEIAAAAAVPVLVVLVVLTVLLLVLLLVLVVLAVVVEGAGEPQELDDGRPLVLLPPAPFLPCPRPFILAPPPMLVSTAASAQSSVPFTVLTLNPNKINRFFNDNGTLVVSLPIPIVIRSCFRTNCPRSANLALLALVLIK